MIIFLLMFSLKANLGTGEMSQQLVVYSLLSVEPRSIPSTNIRCIATFCNSILRWLDVMTTFKLGGMLLFSGLQGHLCAYTMHTYKQK